MGGNNRLRLLTDDLAFLFFLILLLCFLGEVTLDLPDRRKMRRAPLDQVQGGQIHSSLPSVGRSASLDWHGVAQ